MKIFIGKDNFILRNTNKHIERVTAELKKLTEDMFKTMKEVEGIGLAAPQIGKNIKLFIVDELAFDQKRSKWEFKKIPPPDVSRGFAFINPEISSFPRVKDLMEEGCLSLPGWEGSLARSKRLTIKAQDREGRIFKLQAKGLLARVLQHEYDHLQGTLICDKWENETKISKLKSQNYNSKFKNTGIVFFGGSEYSKIILDKLRGTPFEPKKVIGKIGNWKLEIRNYKLGITASYGAIIPDHIIRKFKYGILNIHPSLLPRYRGPSPLQQTILSGDSITGVSIIQLTSKMDAGPILGQKEFFLNKKYTADELGKILFQTGGELLYQILPLYLKGEITVKSQDDAKATYTKLIKKEDALINWAEDAQLIEQKIRAYQPWPVCYTFFDHRGKTMRVQLLKTKVITQAHPQTVCGSIIKQGKEMIIQCGKGNLLIQKLRPEGKREMSGEEFLRGYQATTFFSHLI